MFHWVLNTLLLKLFHDGVPSYRNQSIDLQSKSMDWFLYDRDLRNERVKYNELLVIKTSCEVNSRIIRIKNNPQYINSRKTIQSSLSFRYLSINFQAHFGWCTSPFHWTYFFIASELSIVITPVHLFSLGLTL